MPALTSTVLGKFFPFKITSHLPLQSHFSSLSKSRSPIFSFISILHNITVLKPLLQVHSQIITSGLEHSIFVSNSLLNSYTSNAPLQITDKFFRKTHKNVISCTMMINGYSKNGKPNEALELFCKMHLTGLMPNAVTVASVLPSCAMLGLIQTGRMIHGFVFQSGLNVGNVYVETSLVDMYAKCGDLDNARQVFDEMPQRNVVSWNAIISGYSENGFGEEGLFMFKKMQRNGLVPDIITIIGLLSACLNMGSLQTGNVVRSLVIKSGFEENDQISTILMDVYLKCGCVQNAYKVFDEMLFKDVVAWTMMVSSFSEAGYGNKAVELFNQMLVVGVSLDFVALIEILSVCGRLGALRHGKCIHGLMVKSGFESFTFVGTALIDMYAKCGSLMNARSFFDRMVDKDVVSWNAMIAGNGINGRGVEALDLFQQMKCSGMAPNDSTFISVLCACSHAGLVDQGLEIFRSMGDEPDVKLNLQHYACAVDLLGRAGHLDEAYSLINRMPMQPDSNVYGALLGSCRNHGNARLGLVIAKRLFELEPNDAGFYILMSNIFALDGNWDAVKMTRVLLRSSGLKKTPGFSVIEIEKEVHSFTAGDSVHPQCHEIYEMLMSLICVSRYTT